MRTSERRAMRLAAAVLALATSASPARPEAWVPAGPDHTWRFPRDHWSHPGYRTEWWYFTGHLDDPSDAGRRFGYQFTLFRVGLTPGPPPEDSAWSARDLVMGHASITDLTTGRHVFSEVLHRASPLLGGFSPPGEHPIAWVRPPAGSATPWQVDWDGGSFRFRMADRARGVGFDLVARPVKPLVFQGPGGYSRKSAGGSASLYYSFTRLDTEGTLTLDGASAPVSGVSWMDKEFSSNHLGEGQVGWDWFSLQLDDGTELMLYGLRRADETIDFRHGTRVDAGGRPRYLGSDDFSVAATARWTSPESGVRYPAGWRIVVPSAALRLDVLPLAAGQENVSRLAGGLTYWEGAVEVRSLEGEPLGRGYVELTGYGEDNRPPV